MDQNKTGKFIAQIRKEQSMTQKELADRLGISDKTVSKWETGNGMPDVSMLQPLCEILGVNLNELLSGQRLSAESYNGKAEENMMNLAKDVQEGQKNARRANLFQTIAGIVLLLGILEFTLLCTSGIGGLGMYLDWPTVFILVWFSFGLTLLGGRLKSIGRAIVSAFQKGENLLEEERSEAEESLSFAIRAVIFSAGFSIVIGMVGLLTNLYDLHSLGPSLAVLLISAFYALILCSFLYAMKERLR
ncbi:MAG: helix-turn-helix domain-containing protein [Lachnospiraceae bacterium]|nr:helix-turn-helix domain-containing protein [Lachnospiraceae bacterium]